MTVPKGYREASCRECGAKGKLYIGRQLASGRYKTADYLPHKEKCSAYVRPQAKHFIKKGWVPQEKRANALVGARATLASGAMNRDGDGRSLHQWRVECKQTGLSVFVVRQVIWSKLVDGALQAGEEPLLHIEIHRGSDVDRFVAVRREMCPKYTYSAEETTRTVRLSKSSKTPMPLTLDPPGVILDERQFQEMVLGPKEENL